MDLFLEMIPPEYHARLKRTLLEHRSLMTELESQLPQSLYLMPIPLDEDTIQTITLGMRWKIIGPRLYLNTAPEPFALWFVEYTDRVAGDIFAWGSDLYKLLAGRVETQSADPPYGLTFRIDTYHCKADREEADGRFEKNPTDLIMLRAHLVSHPKIEFYPCTEVTAECTHMAVAEYFGELLRSIAQRWPEAAEQLGIGSPRKVTKTERPPDKRTGAPRLEERNDVEEKRDKALKYQELVQGGLQKYLAAQLVGYPRSTLDRWVSRLLPNNSDKSN